MKIKSRLVANDLDIGEAATVSLLKMYEFVRTFWADDSKVKLTFVLEGDELVVTAVYSYTGTDSTIANSKTESIAELRKKYADLV